MKLFAGFVVAELAGPKNRVHLSLETKMKVINLAKSDSRVTVRSFAEMFGSGRTQISEILNKKESIVLAYESNAFHLQEKEGSVMQTRHYMSGTVWPAIWTTAVCKGKRNRCVEL